MAEFEVVQASATAQADAKRESSTAYMRRYNARKRLRHECRRCSARVPVGRAYCTEHAADMSARGRARAAAKRERGECLTCPAPAAEERAQCEECLEKSREYARAWHRGRVERHCPDCGVVLIDRKRRCPPCREAAAERTRVRSVESARAHTKDRHERKMCLRCPAPAAPNRSRCERHLALAREDSAARAVRKRAQRKALAALRASTREMSVA